MGYTPHVLVVGGDPVGAGIARDLAIRGLDVTLVDAGPIAGSRTSRMSGLLASGARVADRDPALARSMLAENRTLFEIASHTIEDTGGLVVHHDDDEDDAFDRRREACERVGIAATTLSGTAVRDHEPGLAATVDRALRVPDAVVDPCQLTHAVVRDAMEYGATVRPQTAITDITVESGAVQSVTLTRHSRSGETGGDEDGRTDGGDVDVPGMATSPTPDSGVGVPGTGTGTHPDGTGNEDHLEVDYLVNAAEGQAREIAELAGASLAVDLDVGATVVADERLVETPVTWPGVGGETTAIPRAGQTVLSAGAVETDAEASVAGTALVPPETADEVCAALGRVVPETETAPLCRADFHVRTGPTGLGAAGQEYLAIDHGERDDCWGLLSVLGGSLTTHRLVAEEVCDAVCAEFGIRRACQTADLVLPGSEDMPDLATVVGTFGLHSEDYAAAKGRLGSRANAVLYTEAGNPLLCPDRSVSRAEVADARADEAVDDADLEGVRTHTAATMGSCQGGDCGHRLAAELHPDVDPETAEGALDALLTERWRGQRSVAFGDRLARMARTHRLHTATMNRDRTPPDADALEGFDSGPPVDQSGRQHCARPGADRYPLESTGTFGPERGDSEWDWPGWEP